MRDSIRESGDRPTGIEVTTELLAKYVLTIMGVVVTVGGFVTLVEAHPVRVFVKRHPYPFYIGLIVAVLIAMTVLNYALALRKENVRLKNAASRHGRYQPSVHDVGYYAEVLNDIPPDGKIIAWLKRTNVAGLDVADFPADVLSALERVVARSRLQPVGFDDQRVAAAFGTLTDVIEDFRDAVEHWTLVRQNAQWVRGSTESRPVADDEKDAVSSTLASRQASLIQAYDAFLITAHACGMDTHFEVTKSTNASIS